MSIKQISDIIWKITTPVGEQNYEFEIVIIPQGIEVDDELLSWDEIDKARTKVIAEEC